MLNGWVGQEVLSEEVTVDQGLKSERAATPDSGKSLAGGNSLLVCLMRGPLPLAIYLVIPLWLCLCSFLLSL